MLNAQPQNTITPGPQDCPAFARCPIWSKFSSNAKFFWIKSYCQTPKQEKCARRLAKASGQTVPPTLLPNGTHIKSLENK